MKVAILGSTGMLGSMVKRVLSEHTEYELVCPLHENVFAETAHPTFLLDLIRGCDYVINCIGMIKPRIDESNPASVRDAIQVNAMFPHHLAHAAEWAKCKVIQIATDCVYSGYEGPYDELDSHDAIDVYGKTKSLGEVRSTNVRHLRCSIIGPELKSHRSLLDWFLGQPQGAKISGYANHYWNGITTLAFARLCYGIMSGGVEFSSLPLVHHVVPCNTVTKAELLGHFAYFYHRQDVAIEETAAPASVNRVLLTQSPDLNRQLWQTAGYKKSPYIQQMIEELAAYR